MKSENVGLVLVVLSSIFCECSGNQEFAGGTCSYSPPNPDSECSQDVQATENPEHIEFFGPTQDIDLDIQENTLRTCTWKINALNGSSLVLNVIEVHLPNSNNCRDNFLKVYAGHGHPLPGNEIFTTCLEYEQQNFETGLSEVTVVFQVFETFHLSSFKIAFYSVITHDTVPNVMLSFDQIHDCIETAAQDVEESRTLTFDLQREEPLEIRLHTCVRPKGEPASYILMSDDLIVPWKIQCKGTTCLLSRTKSFPIVSGNFTLTARVHQAQASLHFQILFKRTISVYASSPDRSTFVHGSAYNFTCDVLSEDFPEKSWFFIRTSHINFCDINRMPKESEWSELSSKFFQEKGSWNGPVGGSLSCSTWSYSLSVNFPILEPGCLVCWARIGNDTDIDIIPIPVTENEDSGELIITKREEEAIADDSFNLVCSANKFNHGPIKWSYKKEDNANPVPIDDSSDGLISVNREKDWFKETVTVEFQEVLPLFSGTYICETTTYVDAFSGKGEHRQETVKVIRTPVFLGKTSDVKNDTYPVDVTDGLDTLLNCSSRGQAPLSVILTLPESVHKNHDLTQEHTGNEDIFLLKNPLRYVGETISCEVKNQHGSIIRYFEITSSAIDGDVKTNQIAIKFGVPFLVLFLVSTLAGGGFAYRWWKKNGSKDKLPPLSRPPWDPPGGIPVVPDLEFPKKRLIFYETIGKGAFGRVVRAEAIGLLPNEDRTVVAVKMLKENPLGYQKKALLSEIKILDRLGHHLNVVNLLGAVTKHQAQDQVMVIVEYCEKGNLLHYLQKHRKLFINLVNVETGKIEKGIKTVSYVKLTEMETPDKRLLDSKVYRTKKSFWTSETLLPKFKNVRFPSLPVISSSSTVSLSWRKTSTQKLDRLSLTHECIELSTLQKSNMSSSPVESTVSSLHSEDSFLSTSKLYIQLLDFEHSEEDCKKPEDPLNTTDVIKFAYQCALGMQYIASRKLVHRDLSCRNILLTKDNIIKICDFGLCRYNYYLYNDTRKTPMPVRWLSPESLGRNQFTTKSDVWAFGIVLWEMFTLGDTPYPGITVDQLYEKLKGGYRMTPPKTTPKELSNLMLDCWKDNPDERPGFPEIVSRVSDFLEEQEQKYYLRLNDPYEVMNKKTEEDADYLIIIPDWLF